MKFQIGDKVLCDWLGQMRRCRPFGDRTHTGEQPYEGTITDAYKGHGSEIYYIREGMFPGWYKVRYLRLI
jgi:hypothetical protein